MLKVGVLKCTIDWKSIRLKFYLMLIILLFRMTSTEVNAVDVETVRLIRSLFTTDGALESPINLDICCARVVELNPLKWINIDVAPRKLKITNTGHTVILSAKWQQQRPYLSGGPFTDNYIFSQIHFHWGENDMKGSEHHIDGASLPMELHVVHFKSDYDSLDAALRRADGVVVMVYFFKLQDAANEFIDEIVKNIELIRTAHSSARIVPNNLTDLLTPFSEDYLLYWGSIVTAQYVTSILWIVSRIPIGISSEQIAEFRTLKDERDTPILSNIRSLKERQGRHVFYVCPSGSKYASLLPIPRDLPVSEKSSFNKT